MTGIASGEPPIKLRVLFQHIVRGPHEIVLRAAEPFFDARENPKRKKIRLIGVRVEKLLRTLTPDAIQQAIAVTDANRGRVGDPEGIT